LGEPIILRSAHAYTPPFRLSPDLLIRETEEKVSYSVNLLAEKGFRTVSAERALTSVAQAQSSFWAGEYETGARQIYDAARLLGGDGGIPILSPTLPSILSEMLPQSLYVIKAFEDETVQPLRGVVVSFLWPATGDTFTVRTDKRDQALMGGPAESFEYSASLAGFVLAGGSGTASEDAVTSVNINVPRGSDVPLAKVETDRGCREQGRAPIYFRGDPIDINFQVENVSEPFVRLLNFLPNGVFSSLLEQNVTAGQISMLSSQIAAPAGPQSLRLEVFRDANDFQQERGSITFAHCSFFVQAGDAKPPQIDKVDVLASSLDVNGNVTKTFGIDF
jgi:hypothetical protein